MSGTKDDLIGYRLNRAFETLEDSKILMREKRWNSAINRLYYAAFYAVSALLLKHNLNAATHNGAKSQLSAHFIATSIIPLAYGKLYAQLFAMRQKSDYDDLYRFSEELVMPFLQPVEEFVKLIEKHIKS